MFKRIACAMLASMAVPVMYAGTADAKTLSGLEVTGPQKVPTCHSARCHKPTPEVRGPLKLKPSRPSLQPTDR